MSIEYIIAIGIGVICVALIGGKYYRWLSKKLTPTVIENKTINNTTIINQRPDDQDNDQDDDDDNTSPDDNGDCDMFGANGKGACSAFGFQYNPQYVPDTGGHSSSFSYSGYTTTNYGGCWSRNGMHFYVTSQVGNIYQFTVTKVWDITTASYVGTKDLTGTLNYAYGLDINDDGSKIYITDNTNEYIYEFTLSTPYDITTASLNYSLNLTGLTGTGLVGCWIDKSGTYLCTTDSSQAEHYVYKMSTAWDLSTASSYDHDNLYGVGGIATNKFQFSQDGTIALVHYGFSNTVRTVCSTPFKISTKGSLTGAANEARAPWIDYTGTHWWEFDTSTAYYYIANKTTLD